MKITYYLFSGYLSPRVMRSNAACHAPMGCVIIGDFQLLNAVDRWF